MSKGMSKQETYNNRLIETITNLDKNNLALSDRIDKLEAGYKMLMTDWECCANIGRCNQLGYPIEEWCVYCVAEELLGKN